MSYKQLLGVYNESVAGKSYQRNRETLLLELTVNDASIKKFAAKYLEHVIELDFSTPEHISYASNPYALDKMLLAFCKERQISLNSKDVAMRVADSERIKARKYKTTFKNFAYLVGDISWREQRAAEKELAQYLLDLENIEPDMWGDPEDDGIGVNSRDEFNATLQGVRGTWTFLPMQLDKTKMRIRFRFDGDYTHNVITSIMNLFNKRQKILANKDIFAYPNFTELVKALATTRSKSELQQVGANVEHTIQEIKAAIIPCPSKNWIVIKPPNHAFSKKYFGFTRYSIRDILAIADRAEKDPTNREQILSEIANMRKINGATWCTSANKSTHWDLYVDKLKTELYYFISLQSTPKEELYAIRTIGSYGEFAKANSSMSDQMLNNIATKMNDEVGYKKGSHFAELVVNVREVPANMYGRWVRISATDSISTMLNYMYYTYPDGFVHTAIIEVRNQTNDITNSDVIFNDIGEDWALRDMKLIEGIPSMSKEDTKKAALDICMKKREEISNNVNKELVNKFKLT